MKKAAKWSKRLSALVKDRKSAKGDAKAKIQKAINAEYKRFGMNTKGVAKKKSTMSQLKAVKKRERTSSGKGLAQMAIDDENRKNPPKKVAKKKTAVASKKPKTIEMKGATIKSSPTRAKKAVAKKKKTMNMKGVTIASSPKRAKKAVAKKEKMESNKRIDTSLKRVSDKQKSNKRITASLKRVKKRMKLSNKSLTIADINAMVAKTNKGVSQTKNMLVAKKKKKKVERKTVSRKKK